MNQSDHFDLVVLGLFALGVLGALARVFPFRRPPRHGPPPRSPSPPKSDRGTNWDIPPRVGGEGGSRPSAARGASPADLTPVEAAYVAGGPDHAAFLAYLCLVDRGLIEVPTVTVGSGGTAALPASADPSAGLQVKMTGAAPGRLHPLEQAALRQLRLDPGAATLLPTLREATEMASLHDDLIGRGLVVDPSLFKRLTRVVSRMLIPWLGGVVILGMILGSVVLPAIVLGFVIVSAVQQFVSLDGPQPTETGRVVLTHHRRIGAVRGPEGLAGRSGLNILVVAAGGSGVVWEQAPAHATFVGCPPPKRRLLGDLLDDVRPGGQDTWDYRGGWDGGRGPGPPGPGWPV